jgi:cell wall-associated NlpC family hydrolase
MPIRNPAILAILLALNSTAYAESPMAEPAAQASSAALPAPDNKTEDLLLYALSLNGAHYKFGGLSADTGFDCSGFVSHVFQQAAGLALPHNARAISHAGEQITRTELKPGDLVFFNTLRRAFSHVGIYLGDNRFIHASSSTSGDVMISNLTEKYWSKRFDGARRLALSE